MKAGGSISQQRKLKIFSLEIKYQKKLEMDFKGENIGDVDNDGNRNKQQSYVIQEEVGKQQ